MLQFFDVADDTKDYQSFHAKIEHENRPIMEVNGYLANALTRSPWDYYVVTWPGPRSLLSVMSMTRLLHKALANRLAIPPYELYYTFYATKGDQEHNYPFLDAMALNSCIFSLPYQELDFLRVDGIFFSVSIGPLERLENVLPRVCFCSFFNLGGFIYNLYAVSARDAMTESRKGVVTSDLDSVLAKYSFPAVDKFSDYKEQIYERLLHST